MKKERDTTKLFVQFVFTHRTWSPFQVLSDQEADLVNSILRAAGYGDLFFVRHDTIVDRTAKQLHWELHEFPYLVVNATNQADGEASRWIRSLIMLVVDAYYENHEVRRDTLAKRVNSEILQARERSRAA